MPTASPSTRGKRLLPVANVLTAQTNMMLIMGGSLLVTPAILHGLGDGKYGIWLLINSFISYMRLLDLGTSAGTLKYGAGAYERGDQVDLARVFNTTAAVFLVVGSAAGLITLGLAFGLPYLYPSVLEGLFWTILVVGASSTIDFFVRPYTVSLRTKSYYFINDTIEVVTFAIFKLGLVLYFANRGLSFKILALITFGEVVVRNIFIVGIALQQAPFVRRLRPMQADASMFRKLASMAAASAVIYVADLVRFQVDAAVIGFFNPHHPERISIYGLGMRLGSIALQVIGVIGQVMLPKFSGLSEKHDTGGVLDLLRKASLAQSLACSFILVNLFVLGPDFLNLWLQKEWIHESALILRILLPAYYVVLMTGPASTLLAGRGQLRGQAVITVIEAVANLVLSVALAGPYGIIGVALGTAIPMVIIRGFVFPWLLHKTVGIRPVDYFAMHARAIVIGVVYSALIGGLALLKITTWKFFLVLCVASTAVFAALVMAGVPEIRTAVMARLRRRKTA